LLEVETIHSCYSEIAIKHAVFGLSFSIILIISTPTSTTLHYSLQYSLLILYTQNLPLKANMKFSLLAVALSTLAAASPTPDMEHEKRVLDLLKPKTSNTPFTFTSTYEIAATPNQVVDSENKFTGGLKNSHGLFKYGINSHEDIICFNITLYGFRGEYESLANTATHIHEGLKGKAGPPRYVYTCSRMNDDRKADLLSRIAFPDPVGNDKVRNSVGCLKGPFRTGIKANGQDTGVGFTVAQIEKNPAKFFTDSHSSLAVPGAFRGQLDSGKKC
jgi:hypothetical protein